MNRVIIKIKPIRHERGLNQWPMQMFRTLMVLYNTLNRSANAFLSFMLQH